MAQSVPAFCLHLCYNFSFDALDKMSYLEYGPETFARLRLSAPLQGHLGALTRTDPSFKPRELFVSYLQLRPSQHLMTAGTLFCGTLNLRSFRSILNFLIPIKRKMGHLHLCIICFLRLISTCSGSLWASPRASPGALTLILSTSFDF